MIDGIVGKTTHNIYGSAVQVREPTEEQNIPSIDYSIRARRSCIDPIQPLYELFRAVCPYRQMEPNFSLIHPLILERMTQFLNGPMGQWVTRIKDLFPDIKEIFLAGSAARNLGGKELLKYLFLCISQNLDVRIQQEILSTLDTYKFPFSDVDLHFTLPIEKFQSIKDTILSNLPAGVEVIGEPVIRFNLVDRRFDVNDSRRYKSFLKIELKGPEGKVDLVFEPEGQYTTLFGVDDLMVILNGDEKVISFYSSDPFMHCENQIFRTIKRKIIPDHSYHRRMLLSMTRGYYAPQELVKECKKAAADLSFSKRTFLTKVTLASHFAGQNIGQWVYRLAHQMAWGDTPQTLLPDGHILTETFNATFRCPEILPKAHALLQLIGFIALLEDHQGEHCASIRDNHLVLEFPGDYTLWMPCDPVLALEVLDGMTASEWEELKEILTCMPGWIPRGKVNVEYTKSVANCFQNIKLSGFYTLLKSKSCEVLQLRLQAALSSYGAPTVERSQKFWVNALTDENPQISLLQEKLRKHKKNFSDEDIQWMLTILQENNRPRLCREVAERVLRDQNVKAVEFLRLIETYPNIDWEPICKAITDKKTPEEVQRCLQVQRLTAVGIQAVPQEELFLLIVEIKDEFVLIRLAEELLVRPKSRALPIGCPVDSPAQKRRGIYTKNRSTSKRPGGGVSCSLC